VAADGAAKKVHKLGTYELLAKLGQGAMGAVYLARNSEGVDVALKVLPPNLAQDQEFLERFRREARAASKLSHPNIVAALDVGFADKYHYIAMEYVDGPNLEALLKKKTRFNLAEILRIAEDIASALSEAEKHGIVHRDIKPANILMNSKGVCKLTDMGLSSASAGDQRVTMAGFAVGTPYYISPEQARGEMNVDGRADIYSLGATLYHLCTGTLPFPGTNPVVIMTQHISERPQPANVREPSVSPHLSQLLDKMMSKDPAMRPQNAAELKVDLERCAKGEGPIARMPGQTPAAAKPAAPAPDAAAAPAPVKKKSFVEFVNGLIPFLPVALRFPVFAVVVTLLLLGAIFLAIQLLK
jgi:serine/threonine-protein kinase